jgi:sterol desaturase/sphingolipid hydroxylase (fatty acid hydroxylase superfamily)
VGLANERTKIMSRETASVFSTILQQWQPFTAVVVLLLFYLWESIAPFFKNRRHRIRHGGRNLTIAGVNVIVLVLVFSGVTVTVATFTDDNRIGVLHWLGLPSSILAVAAFVLMDLWTYWWHRLNHTIPFLWRFHRMHHSDPEMDVTTATRFHTGEVTISSSLRLFLIPLVGMPIWVLILYDILLLANTQFHHANIALKRPVDRFIRLFVVSPNMHKIHHSRMQIETDSNFSSLLSVWDRIFKSFRKRQNYAEIQFGLDDFDADENQTVKALLTTPLKALR